MSADVLLCGSSSINNGNPGMKVITEQAGGFWSDEDNTPIHDPFSPAKKINSLSR